MAESVIKSPPEPPQSLTPEKIAWSDGRHALLIHSPAYADAKAILKKLDLQQPAALIMIAGEAGSLDKAKESQLLQLFSRAIARAAADRSALIIDGGINSGVMALIGQGVADRGGTTPLLGIAPAGKVNYPVKTDGGSDGKVELDPNHSHFVLVDSQEWGDKTKMMYELAKVVANRALDPLASDADPVAQDGAAMLPTKIRAVTVLAGGGLDGIAKAEVVQSVRQDWPVIVLDSSGQLPDEIAKQWREKRRIDARRMVKRWDIVRRPHMWWPKNLPPIDDPALAEIVAEGKLHIFPLDGQIVDLRNLIIQLLPMERRETTLNLAWKTFAFYDDNALSHQKGFRRLQQGILTLGVLGTFLVLLQTTSDIPSLISRFVPLSQAGRDNIGQSLHYIIVLIPIATSILLGGSLRFNAGNRWVLLRTSAEAIKREIYRYRAKAEIYSDQAAKQTNISREATLANKIQTISRQLMQTDVNAAELPAYGGPLPPKYGAAEADDGFADLPPDRYIELRLLDQLSYYRRTANKLARTLRRLQWWILIIGGVGTFLAAAGLELWIAFTTALVAAFATYLEYEQVNNTLIQYNQAATDLANLQTWWTALSPTDQRLQTNVDLLVKHTEMILANEHAGWVQQMQDALTKLREDQENENAAQSTAQDQAKPSDQSADDDTKPIIPDDRGRVLQSDER